MRTTGPSSSLLLRGRLCREPEEGLAVAEVELYQVLCHPSTPEEAEPVERVLLGGVHGDGDEDDDKVESNCLPEPCLLLLRKRCEELALLEVELHEQTRRRENQGNHQRQQRPCHAASVG